MKPDVKVFTPHYNPGNRAILEAFAAAIGATVHDDRKYVPCDVAVIYGLVKKSFPKSHSKAGIILAHGGKPLLVVERGFVRRDVYYSVGWGGINGTADFVNEDVDGRRWAQLNVPLVGWRQQEGPVLVCGQVPWDVTVQDTDHPKWCRDTVKKLMGAGQLPMFRPHPLQPKAIPGVECWTSTSPLFADLARCSRVVTYCSNTAVDAVIAGVPTVTMSRMSMAWDVTGHDLFDALTPDRQTWAWRIAHAQWRTSEFAAAWEQVRRRLQ